MKKHLKYFSISLALFIAFFFSFSLIGKAQLFQKIPPRTVFASSLNLAFMSQQEAREAIESALYKYLNTPLTLVFNQKFQQATPRQLGVEIDEQELLASLPIITKETSLFKIPALLLSKKQAQLPFSVNSEKIEKIVTTLFPEAIKAGNNAHLSLQNGQKLVIIPEQTGRKINTADIVSQLENIVENLAADEIIIASTQDFPVVRSSELEPQLKDIEIKLKTKIALQSDSNSWKISPLQNPEWISFRYNLALEIPAPVQEEIPFKLPVEFDHFLDVPDLPLTKTVDVQISLDREKFEQYLNQEIAAALNNNAQNVKIYKDEQGRIQFDGTAVNGQKVEIPLLYENYLAALNQAETSLDIPVTVIKAKVETTSELAELGIRELIGMGYSTFYGSPASRNHNIKVGISRYNGLIIAPGQTFSFNSALGPVDGEHGFKKELVIVGNDTKPEYGGGLCQVSSTFFRAILNTGLPYQERHAHSYAVSYYFNPNGPGLDATIYPGHKDVVFLNDTLAHILVESYVYGEQAYFKFYGTDDGRKVNLDGPYKANPVPAPADVIVYTTDLPSGEKKKVDSAHDGFEVTWYRTVTYPDGQEKKDKIFSHYRAWPAKYQIGKEPEQPQP